ncbi:MAG TPA: META domain-containing protein [Coleofasciculaceae cyanobacterium]
MAQAPASIAGNWQLANMTEDPFPTPMVPVGDLTVEFANSKVFGSAGCNRFNGGYKTTGNQLAIGPLASTFMACEPAVMQQETRFLAALQGAQRYEVNDQGLQIFYKTDKASGVMRFTARIVPALW